MLLLYFSTVQELGLKVGPARGIRGEKLVIYPQASSNSKTDPAVGSSQERFWEDCCKSLSLCQMDMGGSKLIEGVKKKKASCKQPRGRWLPGWRV